MKKAGKIILCVIGVFSLLLNAYFVIEPKTTYKMEDSSSYLYESISSNNGKDYSGSYSNSYANANEMIVRNTTITLEVKNNAEKYEELRAKTASYQGMIQSSSSYKYGDTMRYYLVVRIPTMLYEDFISYLKNEGEVTDFSENGYSVSEEYSDNSLRIEMYENKLQRLNDLLKQAENMSDLIVIENSISDTIYEIERLKGSNRVLKDESDYATIHITLSEKKETVKKGIFDNLFTEAFTDSLNAFLSFISFMIRVIFFLFPYALILAAVYYLIIRPIKKRKAGNMDVK